MYIFLDDNINSQYTQQQDTNNSYCDYTLNKIRLTVQILNELIRIANAGNASGPKPNTVCFCLSGKKVLLSLGNTIQSTMKSAKRKPSGQTKAKQEQSPTLAVSLCHATTPQLVTHVPDQSRVLHLPVLLLRGPHSHVNASTALVPRTQRWELNRASWLFSLLAK